MHGFRFCLAVTCPDQYGAFVKRLRAEPSAARWCLDSQEGK
jgi:hypothetical protein